MRADDCAVGVTTRIEDIDRDRYGLIRRTSALRAGLSDDQLRTAVQTGTLTRLCRGVFMLAQSPEFARTEAGKDARYPLASIAGATSTRAGDAPLSHHWAAALHRLPLLHPDRSTVHVIRGGPGGSTVRGPGADDRGRAPRPDPPA